MSSEPGEKLRDLASLRIDRASLDARPSRSPWLRWVVTLVIVAVIVAAGAASWQKWVAPLRMPEVETALAIVQSPSQSAALLTAAGYVVAQRQASVTSKVPGRLAELSVREGSRVKAGQVLGRIESRDAAASLEEARRSLDVALAAHAESLARANEAKREFDRQSRLLKEGVSSPSAFDTAEAKHRVALAQTDSSAAAIPRAEAMVTLAEVALENTLIVSPFDGVVIIKNAEIGEIVAPVSVGGPARGNSVIEIADMDSLETEVDINESNIARLEEGQPAEIVLDAFPERRYPGRLRQIVPTANRQKATIQGKVAFVEKGNEVLPEMSARVTFLETAPSPGAALKSRVFAPKAAILSRGGIPVVFVVRDGKAALVRITTGPDVEGRVEILSGLAGGETLVVNSPAGLEDGARVRLRAGS